jgi:hypothetical protein
MTNTKQEEDNSTVGAAERLLVVMLLALQTSRNRFERQLIKGLLLKAGITSLTNSKDNTFVIRERKKK